MTGSSAVLLCLILFLAGTSAVLADAQRSPLENTKIEPLLAFRASRGPVNEVLDAYLITSQGLTGERITELSRIGVLRGYSDRIVTMSVSRGAILSLVDLPYVERIGGGKVYRLALDKSVPEIGADALWSELRDVAGRPITGAGVAIGVVDTGIDVSHRDFFFENGTSKILFVWDQTVGGRPPLGFSYGTEWSRSDIDRRIVTATDTHGHGTHVAGIAAGTGMASGKWSGVAPGASLIVVKSGRPACRGTSWSFGEAQLLDALNYIWEKSKSLGVRSVINLSLGGHVGGHDGTDPMEVLLNEISSDGIVVTVAGGNSGARDIHAKGSLGRGESATVPWVLDGDVTDVVVDVWHDLTDNLEIVVTTPRGLKVVGPTSPAGIQTESGRVSIARAVREKGVNWQVEVASGSHLTTSGWSFTVTGVDVRGTGRWDSYISSNSCTDSQTAFVLFSDPSGSVGIPATASKVIAVGAYVTEGRLASSVGLVGGIASFSSIGPTRDGRTKPDIAAPGADIVSSLSAQSTGLRRFQSFGGDEKHVPLRGTSMAAPHVAGLAALLLQSEASLSPEQVLERIKAGAQQDSFTGSIDRSLGSDVWGWGKVSAAGSAFLFPVTISLEGLISPLKVNLTIDGSRTRLVSADGARLWFAPGTSHKITVPEVTQVSSDMRYLAERTSFEVSGRSSITIRMKPQFLLTIKSNNVTPQGAGWYDRAVEVTLTAEEIEEGGVGTRFLFRGWLVNSTLLTGAELKLKMDRPHSVESLYSKQYLLSITSDGEKPLGAGWYDDGEEITLTVSTSAETGVGERLIFSHWQVDGTMSREPQLKLLMTGPHKVHASFIKQYLLTVVSPIGQVSGAGWYDTGSQATFSVEPSREGFPIQTIFAGWKGDFTGSSSTATVSMDGPKLVEAVWATDYTLLFILIGLMSTFVAAGVFVIKRRERVASN